MSLLRVPLKTCTAGPCGEVRRYGVNSSTGTIRAEDPDGSVDDGLEIWNAELVSGRIGKSGSRVRLSLERLPVPEASGATAILPRKEERHARP